MTRPPDLAIVVPLRNPKGWCPMITVPMWLFASLCAVAGLAALAATAALARAQHLVDRILDDELAPPPLHGRHAILGDQEAADRADRGQP